MDRLREHQLELQIQSLPKGDSLDARVPRNTLDLVSLRAEHEEAQEQVGNVARAMQKYLYTSNITIQKIALQYLHEEPDPKEFAVQMQSVGAVQIARELISLARRCSTALEEYLTRRETELGDSVPNDIKGRIRDARGELARTRAGVEESERFLRENESRLPHEESARIRSEIGVYRRKERELRALEAQLVDPRSYHPPSEMENFSQIVRSFFSLEGTHGNR